MVSWRTPKSRSNQRSTRGSGSDYRRLVWTYLKNEAPNPQSRALFTLDARALKRGALSEPYQESAEDPTQLIGPEAFTVPTSSR